MRKPNILFILADDLGWCDLGSGGSSFYETPNIDRIAREGMRFTQGYAACQVCSPSRASILTGKYPPRHGITDYIGALSGEDWRKAQRFSKLLPPAFDPHLRPDEITFAEVFRRSGYRTFYAGKWHLGDQGRYPEDFGFEINKGGWSAGGPHGGYFAPWENPKLPPGPKGESLPLRLAKETAQFLADNRETPFLAFLSFYSVHCPIETSRDKWKKFREKAIAKKAPARRFEFDGYLPVRQIQDCPVYAGMIESMDEAVGMVLAKLDELGLHENTIVCFTSDNGGVSSGDAYSSSMLPLRGGKGRQWEGGIREPFYFKIPGMTVPGATCDVPVSGIDYYPTLLELAGLALPPEQIVDGKSIVPLLKGEPCPQISRRDLYWHYPHYGNQGGAPSSMIRSDSWKLIHYYEDGHDELYHLKDDPGEQHDLAAECHQKTAELRPRLDSWLKETDALRPTPDPYHDPEKEKKRLEWLKTDFMVQLETQHAKYLDPDWQPNPDWWGSRMTED